MERSMKGRRVVVETDAVEVEESGDLDGEDWVNEHRCWCEGLEGSGMLSEDVDGGALPAEVLDDTSDGDFVMLSDLSSEAVESEWEIVI